MTSQSFRLIGDCCTFYLTTTQFALFIVVIHFPLCYSHLASFFVSISFSHVGPEVVQGLACLLTEGLITTSFWTNSSPVLQARPLLPYKDSGLVLVFGHMALDHTLICCYFKIPSSSLLITKPGFPKWSHSFSVPTDWYYLILKYWITEFISFPCVLHILHWHLFRLFYPHNINQLATCKSGL
jgi:hypothetical protein